MKHFPSDIADRNDQAYNLVPRALDEIFGKGAWRTEKRAKKTGPGETTWVVLK